MFKYTLSVLTVVTIVTSAGTLQSPSKDNAYSYAYSDLAINLFELCTDAGKNYQVGARLHIKYSLQECKK